MLKKQLLRIIPVLIVLLGITAGGLAAGPINSAGYYKGIRLAGKVKVVEHFADIKVQVVSSFPDLKVQVVDHFPDKIGQWQFVDYGQDFTVQLVKSFGDIKIQYVSSFPGVS